jgi:hypothetical protein
LIVLAGAITVGTYGESGTIDTRKLTAGAYDVAAGKRAAFCAHAGRRRRADRRHWPLRGDSNMSQHSDLSYVSGVGTQPLLGETIGRVLRSHPSTVSVSAKRWWSGTRTYAGAIASCSDEPTILPSRCCGLVSTRRAHRHLVAEQREWLLAQLATAKAGLILVNINPAYRSIELQYALNKVQCRALIVSTVFQVEQLSRDAAGARARSSLIASGKVGRRAALPSLSLLVIRLGEGKNTWNAEFRRAAQ